MFITDKIDINIVFFKYLFELLPFHVCRLHHSRTLLMLKKVSTPGSRPLAIIRVKWG